MTNIISEMTKEELVAKCTNQRIEIKNLLNAITRHDNYVVNREQAIRIAIRHLKANSPTVALSTLQGYVKDANKCLRELAKGGSNGQT